MRIVFMENKRESYSSKFGNKIRAKNQILCIQMYGDLLRYHLLVALVIMLLLLTTQLEKTRFIIFEINMMYLILSRNGKIWLKMRQEKG